MPREKKNQPTDAEMAILQVLWEHGPCTVRAVQNELEKERGTGYTTTLKLMQIMLEKKLVSRDESRHAHIYRAAITRQKTQKQLVGQMMDKLFDGSAKQLVMQALSASKSSASELAEIRELIEELEAKNTRSQK